MTDNRPDLMFIGSGFHAKRTEDDGWEILTPVTKMSIMKVKDLHEFHEKMLSIKLFDDTWSFTSIDQDSDINLKTSEKRYKYADNFYYGLARVDCLDGSGWTYTNIDQEIMKHRFEVAFNFSNYWAVVKPTGTTINEGWTLVNSNGRILKPIGLEALAYVADPLKLALMIDPKNFFTLPDKWFLDGNNLNKYLKIADEAVDNLSKTDNEIYSNKNCKIIKNAFRAKIESVRNPRQGNNTWEEYKSQLNIKNEIKTLNQ